MTPLMGALLRLAHTQVWGRIVAEVRAAGFDDLGDTEYRVFQYPGPEGARPSELAQRCGLTKQALNYVLAGLERKNYLERGPARTGGGRVISLTARGRKLIAKLRATVREIERELASEMGAKRLDQMRRDLAGVVSHLKKPRRSPRSGPKPGSDPESANA